MRQQKYLNHYIIDFIRSEWFRRVFGGLIAALAVLMLVSFSTRPWIQVPAADLEHKPHLDVQELQGRSAVYRAGVRSTDILLAIGETRLNLENLDSLDAILLQEVNAALDNDATRLALKVHRNGEETTVQLPLEDFEAPVEFITAEDIGLNVVAITTARELNNPAGGSLSALDVMQGGNEDIPSLDLGDVVAGEVGTVRDVDRTLIFVFIAPLLLLGLAVLYLRDRISHGRALSYMALVALVIWIFPFFWQMFSSMNWRSDLIENYDGQSTSAVIADDLVNAYNLSLNPIEAHVAGGQRSVNILHPMLVQFNNTYNTSSIGLLGLGAMIVAAVGGMLLVAERENLLVNQDRMMAILTIAPSMILLAIFVYVFIGQTLNASLTDWGEESKGAPPPLQTDVTTNYIGLENYQDLMTDLLEFPFRNSLVNTFFFTIFFLLGCLLAGFILAFLIDQRVMGEGVFRTIFLFPMSLSFVVTGTIWRWLLKPNGGLNILPEKLTSWLPDFLQVGRMNYSWIDSRNHILGFSWEDAPLYITLIGLAIFGLAAFNYAVQQRWRATTIAGGLGAVYVVLYLAKSMEKIWPALDVSAAEIEKGYNAALSGVIIAAVWQMSGYVMALFLAGIRGVSDDLREAARVDGCAEWQVYLYIILPSLRPIVLSAVIILGHISLKIFDLVFAMAGPDNNQTVVPGILLYTKAFRGNRLASGSAIAVLMLLLVSVVIVPYLRSSLRSEEETA